MPDISTLTLNNGVTLPAIGLGVFQTPPEETRAAVTAALKAGYRHIDTAAAYGNERQVGEAIAASDLNRSEVFVETKIWISDYGYDQTLHGFDRADPLPRRRHQGRLRPVHRQHRHRAHQTSARGRRRREGGHQPVRRHRGLRAPRRHMDHGLDVLHPPHHALIRRRHHPPTQWPPTRRVKAKIYPPDHSNAPVPKLPHLAHRHLGWN